ncbi:MAG: hypothetical protein NZL93_05310, partial [Chthoniobacterales bacterium]|nr:hypothetical protein [Chthoniobacterales bacterium]
MDWKTWIAVGLSIVGLFIWQHYYMEEYRKFEAARRQHVLSQQIKQDEQVGEKVLPTPRVEAESPAKLESKLHFEPELLPQTETLTVKDAQYVFNNDTGGIEEVVLPLHLAENGEAVHLNRNRSMPIGAIGTRPGEALGGVEMEVLADQKVVTFT